jgi:hypothetical protein
MTIVYWVVGIVVGLIIYVKVLGSLAKYFAFYIIYYPKSLTAKIFFPFSPLLEKTSPFTVEEPAETYQLREKFRTFEAYYKSRGSIWFFKIVWFIVVCLIYIFALVSWVIQIGEWFIVWLFDLKK